METTPAIFQIAIDGPSGSGKSTMARRLAAALGIGYLDTGAMYRALGFAALRRGIRPSDPTEVEIMLQDVELDVSFADGCQQTLIDGEDVSPFIRTPDVSMAASDISALPAVRGYCVDKQRRIGETHAMVLDGRDIGTYVLPDADLKFFLTAGDDVRAGRRYLDLVKAGVSVDMNDVLHDLRVRDRQDSTRELAPTLAASDAILIDTSELSEDQVFDLMLRHCAARGLTRG